MHPALSVIFLTTLIGAGQGVFLGVYAAELNAALDGAVLAQLRGYILAGSAIALLLNALGLVASFFHLGHPERAWRAAAGWRTSWLSREVIALPAFMAAVAAYGLAHYAGASGTLALGALASVLCAALFVCTGMIYASVRVIREWASPLTVANYFLLGTASGFTLATALAAVMAQTLARPYALAAGVLTVTAFALRAASLARNARLRPTSTLQSAIGVKHPRIVQKAQGAMGGSFNTREFFHGATVAKVRAVKWSFLLLGFALPLVLLAAGSAAQSTLLFGLAFVVQYLGLLAERWFFFAQANHPQNLYYRSVA